MGCYATRAPEEAAALPGVAEVVTDKRELPDLLARLGVVDVPDGISDFADRQRAYVKVQDGCVLRCSFCIIPQIRPHLVSRPPEAILAEIRRLTDAGFREIILTGIHLGHYGLEWSRGRPKSEWTRLPQLCRAHRALERRFSDSPVEHRGHGGDSRAVGRHGGASRASLPSFACFDAKRIGVGVAANAAAVGSTTIP